MLALVTSALALTTAPSGRKLSYTEILAYSPGSDVTDHANIDIDQKSMESALKLSIVGKWDLAQAIYTTGAASKPTAVCTITNPAGGLAADVLKKASVTFTTEAGVVTTGKAYENTDSGENDFMFTYPVSTDKVTDDPTTLCYAGGRATADQQTDGCIASSVGSGASGSTFTIGATTYTADCTNRGKRTLQGFSSKAESTMATCTPSCPTDATYSCGCPYTTYMPYYNYYGDYKYADTIVTAGFTGGAVTTFTNGNFDLTPSGFTDPDKVRTEFIKKGTAYMNAWMYAIREFEDAIDDCAIGDLTANAISSGPVHAWDEGVAFYTGSLMLYEHLLAGNLDVLDDEGKLAYTLANKRCRNYKTCGPSGDSKTGEAKANHDLFQLFHQGQHELLVGNCAGVVPVKDEIFKKMTVPLVQGTMRYAYKVGVLGGADKEKAEGAIFSLAVLPQVHACSSTHAATIEANMNVNSASCDFAAVKAAFEACYDFMGVTCADVGGLLNGDDYYTDFQPCVTASPPPPPVTVVETTVTKTKKSKSSGGDGSVGIVIAAVVAGVLLIAVIFIIMKEKAGKPIFTNLDKTQASA